MGREEGASSLPLPEVPFPPTHINAGVPGWELWAGWTRKTSGSAVHWHPALLPALFLDSDDQADVNGGRTVIAQEGVTVQRGEVAMAWLCP